MSQMVVPPGLLRSFASACRGVAAELAALDAGDVGSSAAADLPGTETAVSLGTAGADLAAAIDVLAQRMREVADVADGTQDDYDATEAQVVAGFDRMSRP